jgi:hypothetical protein
VRVRQVFDAWYLGYRAPDRALATQIHERLLSSEYRTPDPDDADFFLVPFDARMVTHARAFSLRREIVWPVALAVKACTYPASLNNSLLLLTAKLTGTRGVHQSAGGPFPRHAA